MCTNHLDYQRRDIAMNIVANYAAFLGTMLSILATFLSSAHVAEAGSNQDLAACLSQNAESRNGEAVSTTKNGHAMEYNIQGHRYRVWEPMRQDLPDGGIVVSLKIDHIRRTAKDDHAFVRLTVNDGRISKSEVSLALASESPQISEVINVPDVPVRIVRAATLIEPLIRRLIREDSGREVLKGVLEIETASLLSCLAD